MMFIIHSHRKTLLVSAFRVRTKVRGKKGGLAGIFMEEKS